MAKPRNSVLYMFDPLQQSPCTPRRDSSDDLGPSDKENDIPPGDLTVFFSRTFAAPKQPQAHVTTPSGKLVDIGDTPASERAWDGEHDGSDADGEQSESDVEGCGVLSPPRVPFTELDVEHTPRPQDSSRPLKAPVFSLPTSPCPSLSCAAEELLPAPQSSPLADVVNSINFSALSISGDGYPNSPQAESAVLAYSQSSSPFPQINVCEPETSGDDPFSVQRETPMKEPTTAAHLRPTTSLTQLTPDDPRRTSVDLYSSFHLQLQSDDMSFDLLNDKVSFFGHTQDSFLAGGDDTLDFGEICLPSAMKAKIDELVPNVELKRSPKAPCLPPVFSPPARSAFIQSPPIMSPTTETAVNVPLPMSPTFSAPPSRNITPPRLSPPTFEAPPSPPTSPLVVDEPSLLLESAPLPPPVPIPALRIAKKTFKIASHVERPSASTASATEKSGLVAKKRSSIAPKAVPAGAQPRPAIRGVQRPPQGMQGSGVVIGLPPQGAAATSSSTTSTSSSGASTGPRQTVPTASRFAGIQRPNLAAKERAAPRAVTGAPRGASATTTAGKMSAPVRAVAATIGRSASALRPPTRVATTGSTALPKPVSRLPGLTRTTSMSSGSAPSSSSGAASRVKAATFSRATGRF